MDLELCVNITMEKELASFKKFITLVRGHVYSEPETSLHNNVMDQMIPKIIQEHGMHGPLLDVGCGNGGAMERMQKLGLTDLTGLTLSHDDAEAARAKGFHVDEVDMSFTDYADTQFHWLFVRHALEHSPFPLLTLLEFHRILAQGGMAYIEMPSPKCTRLLEAYDNHYSIMGPRQWSELMKRAGFEIADMGEITFNVSNKEDPNWQGTEVYEWYVIKKP